MEAIKSNSFRTDHVTACKRLLAINGFSKEHSYNPHNVKAYVIHNEYGVICYAIGSHLSEALDNAVNNDCLDSCLVTDETELKDRGYYTENDNELCLLGNAGEPFDLDYIGVLMEVAQYR